MFKIVVEIPRWREVDGGAAAAIERIKAEVGALIVEHVRAVLGTDWIYRLSPEYSKRKIAGKTKPPMKRYPGKAADQPLILSGEMYEGVQAELSEGAIVVSVDEGAGIDSRGDDYAEMWEQRVHYLELGMRTAEPLIAPLVCRIIAEEMGL